MAFVSTLITWPITQAIAALTEIDEVYQEKLPDGRIKVTFVTTGLYPTLAKAKTWLWAIFGVPVQRIEEFSVEELQKGPILKRYRITVVLSPFGPGLLRRGPGSPGQVLPLARRSKIY